jgi:serine/threonine protein phosphatase PrpC
MLIYVVLGISVCALALSCYGVVRNEAVASHRRIVKVVKNNESEIEDIMDKLWNEVIDQMRKSQDEMNEIVRNR